MNMRNEFYDPDDYGDYEDDCEYYDDETGCPGRDLWEYEAEFDRAAREIERSHRTAAARILTVLIVFAAAMAIYLGVNGYLSGKNAEEPAVRVSFVWIGEEQAAESYLPDIVQRMSSAPAGKDRRCRARDMILFE